MFKNLKEAFFFVFYQTLKYLTLITRKCLSLYVIDVTTAILFYYLHNAFVKIIGIYRGHIVF